MILYSNIKNQFHNLLEEFLTHTPNMFSIACGLWDTHLPETPANPIYVVYVLSTPVLIITFERSVWQHLDAILSLLYRAYTCTIRLGFILMDDYAVHPHKVQRTNWYLAQATTYRMDCVTTIPLFRWTCLKYTLKIKIRPTGFPKHRSWSPGFVFIGARHNSII